MPQHQTQEPRNVVGAVIFFSYIVAALAISGIIVYDLWSLYKARSLTSQHAQHGARRLRLQSCVLMTLLSFSTLSYHMLSFLIDSYSKWSLQTRTALPSSILGEGSLLGLYGTRTELQIWRWATSSTLFQDFAEAIIRDPRSQFWTEKVLLYSFLWNCYMAEKGGSNKLRVRMIKRTDVCRLASACSKALGVLRHQSDLTGVVFPESPPGSLPITAC